MWANWEIAALAALITVNAGKYYRSMMEGGAISWNIRDSHMQETLERLLEFHGRNGRIMGRAVA